MTNPLDIACIYGHYETIFALKDEYGVTENAIIIAAKNNHTNVVIDLLKYTNIDANILKDSYNNTLLCISSSKGNLVLAERLIKEFNANVNIRNINANSPLILAANTDNLPMVELLLQNGAIINVLNNYGNSAFIIACYRNNTEIIDILLTKYKLSVNTLDDDGNTALIINAKLGNINFVRKLLTDYNASVSLKNNEGKYDQS